MKAFAALYRRLDSGTSTRAKQAAMVEFFAAAKADPAQWASAAWTVYFLSGGKPRQTAPTRLLWRLAVEGSGYPDWLCAECYGAVGDLAEMLSLLLPEGMGGEEVSLDVWMRERLLPLPSLAEEERYARLKQWVGELPTDERLAFFKLITGELRVGVSRLQVVKALAEVAGVDEGRMAQRLIGYSQARRIPTAADFEALIGEVLHTEAQALDAGKPYPFYLAQSWSRPLAEMLRNAWAALGLDHRMEVRRHPRAALEARRQLAPVVARRRADLRRLSRSRAAGARAALGHGDRRRACRAHPARARVRDGFARWPRDLREPAAETRPQDRQRKDEARIAGRVHRLRPSGERGPRPARRAAACAPRSARSARRSPVRGSEDARRAPADPDQPDRLRRHMGGARGEARAGAGASRARG